MNIFCLDESPIAAAKMHCDSHTVKMILESAQMLCTAHRVLDGKPQVISVIGKNGKPRKKKVWTLDSSLDSVLYKVAHLNHPSTVWTRQCSSNYDWHYELFIALCDEYTRRYGRVHKCDRLFRNILKNRPKNIANSEVKTPFALAMNSRPECINHSDPIGSYRKFYQTKQDRMKMIWTNTQIPDWFKFYAIC